MTAARGVRPFFGREASLLPCSSLPTAGRRESRRFTASPASASPSFSTFAEARAIGATVLALDCRSVEPTERGFLGAAGGFDDVGALDHFHGRSAVLALDHYEVFRLMDTWLRQVLVPLPDGVSVVISGRERPVAGWFGLEGFRSLPLGALEARTPSRCSCTTAWPGPRPAAEQDRARPSTRAHALVRQVPEHPELALEDAALTRVVDELSRIYLEDVEDELARRALEAASVVRRATEPLLGDARRRTAPRRSAACSTSRSWTRA